MGLFPLLTDYLAWHYGRAIASFLHIWKNFFWFFYHFFSIWLLLKTLFLPWRRIQEKKGAGFDIDNFFSNFIVNTMMRIVGFLIRIIFILAGIIAEIMVFLFGILSFFIWIFMPVVIFISLTSGIALLFK